VGFEPKAHRSREFRTRIGIGSKEGWVRGARLMEWSSLLIRRSKGNLPVRQ
jgi:hypothetical protein